MGSHLRQSVYKKNIVSEAKDSSSLSERSLKSVKSVQNGVKYVLKEVVSSRGKWFMIRMLGKEWLETMFQFLGLVSEEQNYIVAKCLTTAAIQLKQNIELTIPIQLH